MLSSPQAPQHSSFLSRPLMITAKQGDSPECATNRKQATNLSPCNTKILFIMYNPVYK